MNDLKRVLNKFSQKILLEIRYLVPIQLKRLIFKKTIKKEAYAYKNDPNVFSTIYKDNVWNSDESRSGPGSQLNTTRIIREKLPVLFRQFEIKTFLDVPCGDYNWMKEVDKQNIIYKGGDIVPELIEENNQKYKTENVSFEVIDITRDILPTVDMIFCRECLQHLSYENVFKALNNIKCSGSKYFLVTSYPSTISNWDIFDGDYRPLNLTISPFNLPRPLLKIHEKSDSTRSGKDKYLYLYKLEDMKLPKIFI